jgi:multidrug transporter EmrE-like cation transporter
MNGYVFLIIAFVLNGSANVLLKVGATTFTPADGVRGLVRAWQLPLGVVLFAANVLFYALALRALPLAVAYPVMVAASFLIVIGYGAVVLREPVSAMQAVGFALILIGIIMAVSSAKQ